MSEEHSSPNGNATSPGINWAAIAPGLAFVVIVGIGLALYLSQQAEAKRLEAQVRQEAKQLGLPSDYPLREIPIYPRMEVGEVKRDETVSTDNRPMDKWEIRATSPDDKKQIFDFFKDKLLGRGMGQTQYISTPTGYGVNYSDERYHIELEMEKFPTDKATRIVMRVHRIK
jgi:hypothetical protein